MQCFSMIFAVIAWCAFYLSVVALVGAGVLACIPRFPVNKVNVSLFVVGAIIGWVVTLLAVVPLVRALGWRPPEWASFAMWAILLAGPIACGVGMVGLKMKFSRFAAGGDKPS